MSLTFWKNRKIRMSIIGGLVLLCAVLAFVIRMFPAFDLRGTGDMIAGPDAWYNLRLTEYLLQTGTYPAFDPMTQFPDGSVVGWGPLFTYISAFFAIIAGAVSRVAVIDVVSWVPVIMAACMVPVMYFLGKKLGDWKTGLISALFIAVIGSQYFSRSLYGYFDHHIGETLFSTLFCLCYVLAIVHTREKKIEWKNFASLRIPILFGVISGIAYLLGIMTMTTIIVFGLFAAVFTLIQFIVDYKNNHPTEYLVILNTLTFLIAGIGIIIYGFRDSGFSLYMTSPGVLIAQILVILGTLFLYFWIKGVDKLKSKMAFRTPWLIYLLGIVVLAVVGTIVCALAFPDLFHMIVGNFASQFSAATGGGTTIQEAAPWSMDYAIKSFNWGLLLAALGAIVLLVKLFKEKSPATLFVLIWSFGTFVLACSQIRWEYYFAANIALLSAIFVGWSISFAIPDMKKLVMSIKKKSQKGSEIEDAAAKKGKSVKRVQREAANNKPSYLIIGSLVLSLLVAGAFVGISTSDGFSMSQVYGKGGGTAPYWLDACEWMGNNTPQTGVDYYGKYDKDTFTYPDDAYSVVSWWDFGHYISTIAKRIPVGNPFQAGVAGEYGVAKILMETDEAKVAEKLDHLKTKYVMVDYNTGNNFIPVMAVWANKQLNSYNDFYGTLAFRLYNLIGSQSTSYSIPALQHFRLVYDSPKYTGGYDNKGNVVGQTARIFEYVKGAVIKGEGTIKTTLTVGSGTVVYEQKSVNGQFIVPYATGKNGAVTASIYTIDGSNQTFTVTEDQVQKGLTVN